MNTGDTFPTQTYDVSRADLVRYAAASGDHNPIHQDEQVAVAVGLPGVIAHGMFTMALVARSVATWSDDAEVVQLGCKFTSPVVVPEGGTSVRIGGTVTSVDASLVTIALEVTCDGKKVLGMPKAVVRA